MKKSSKGKHTLGPLKISLQFLENHKTQYLELHRELLKLEYLPQTDAALQNFKTLCLLEISLLMGFDIDWGTGDGGELSGAPVLPAGAKVLPAGASADDKDHSDEDVPLLTPRDSASANAAAAAAGPAHAGPAPADTGPTASPAAAAANTTGPAAAAVADVNDFTTWTSDNWAGVDFGQIDIPTDPNVSICSARSYHAVAMILWYDHEL